MRFGVNYIPSKNWLHFWIDFDEEAVRADLKAIKSIGMDHIRAHLIWPYFQINPTKMCDASMNNLRRFTRLCEEEGLDFCLSLFTGWMSGFHFIPAFMHLHHEFAMFSGKDERKYERFYIRSIASVVAGSPAFLGFDLGNELSCVTHLDKNATIEVGDDWQREMLAVCEECAPGKLHNNGVDHCPWFMERDFSREDLANTGALSPVHCWVFFTGAIEHGGILSTSGTHVAEYMAELVKAYSNDPQRQIWVQEFGCSKEWLRSPEESIEKFLEKTFHSLAGVENIWGITWWCSHDLPDELSGYVDLEYDLGLIDVNNQPKPAANVMKALIEEYKKNPTVPAKRSEAIIYRKAKDGESNWTPASDFMAAIDKGIHPAIVLPERANDKEYLASRGIEHIVCV